MADNTGPAFPTTSAHQNGPHTYHYEGMSLRYYFAAKAMAALIVATQSDLSVTRNDMCGEAVNYADGMLAALAAKEGE